MPHEGFGAGLYIHRLSEKVNVASSSQPPDFFTGISNVGGELTAKQLGFLHELLPTAVHFAVLQHVPIIMVHSLHA
jgi:hypothetical protein